MLMNHRQQQRVQHEYANSRQDATRLFQTVLSIAQDVGLDPVLEYLEQCVIARRLAWFEQNAPHLERSRDPLRDGYRIFYETYLGLATPRDGEIVAATDRRWVTRWWNPCPTLEACKTLGLDTRIICKRVYEQPVNVLLQQIDSRLEFSRSYDTLRPYGSCCEEILSLGDHK